MVLNMEKYFPLISILVLLGTGAVATYIWEFTGFLVWLTCVVAYTVIFNVLAKKH